MLIPSGPQLRTDERSGADHIERQHGYHLLDSIHFGAGYERTAVALLALRTAARVKPDLPADAGVGGRQDA